MGKNVVNRSKFRTEISVQFTYVRVVRILHEIATPIDGTFVEKLLFFHEASTWYSVMAALRATFECRFTTPN